MTRLIRNLSFSLSLILLSFPASSQANEISGDSSVEPEVSARDDVVVPSDDFALPQNTTVNDHWASEGYVEVPAEGQVEFPAGGQVTFEEEGQVEGDAENNSLYIQVLPIEDQAQVNSLVNPYANQQNNYEANGDASEELQYTPIAGIRAER